MRRLRALCAASDLLTSMPNGMLDEGFVPSTDKPPGRRVWSFSPGPGQAAWAAIFLDAELYIERVDACAVLSQLEKSKSIAPMIAVFVSNNDAAARHSDYICDTDYGAFLVRDVIPWICNHHSGNAGDKLIIAGLSLSGLAAAHAAVTHPNYFRGAICQSPSLWWNSERFRSSLPPATKASPALWVSVGDEETEHGVSHPPSGMYQGASQIDACQRGCDALMAAEYRVKYRAFNGGHDPSCWQKDLALALPWVESAGVEGSTIEG